MNKFYSIPPRHEPEMIEVELIPFVMPCSCAAIDQDHRFKQSVPERIFIDKCDWTWFRINLRCSICGYEDCDYIGFKMD